MLKGQRGTFHPKKMGRGQRKSATAQLGSVARTLLAVLWHEEMRLRTGTPEQRQKVENEGITWNLPAFAAAVAASPSSTSRCLGMLEQRRLVCCWAKGTGNNRRIQSVKLSAQAVEVAQSQKLHPGETQEQFDRRLKREWLAERDEAARQYDDL